MWFYIFLSTGIIAVMVLGGLIVNEIRYKFIVVERQMINNRRIIRNDKARIYLDKNKNKWLRLKKERDAERKFIPLPPSAAIEVTIKGKKFVEFYRNDDGTILYIKDDGIIKPFPVDIISKVPKKLLEIENSKARQESIEAWKKKALANWKEKNKVTSTYQPLTTHHRALLIENYKQAHARRQRSWKENIPNIVAISALVLIIIALMVFWGDIAKPALDGQQLQKGTVQLQKETIELLKEIKQGIQTLEGANSETPKEEPPN